MPRIEYDVVFNIDEKSAKKVGQVFNSSAKGKKKSAPESQADNLNRSLLRASNTAELTGQKLQELATSSSTSFSAASRNADAFARSVGNTNKQVGQGNKQFASANQLVFSFSDGIQDAAQFSQGFGAGMRAIGNNISFTAELLGVTAKQAKETGVSMKTALKDAITPVNAGILALNVGLTVGQFIWNEWGKSGKEAAKQAETAIESFISQSKRIIGDSGFSFLNKANIEAEIRTLKQMQPILESAANSYDDIATTAFEAQKIARTLSGEERQMAMEELTSRNKEAIDTISLMKDEYGLTEEAVKDLNKQLEAEIENLNKRTALTRLSPFGSLREDVEQTSSSLIDMFSAGILETGEGGLIQEAVSLEDQIKDLQRNGVPALEALFETLDVNQDVLDNLTLDEGDVARAINILKGGVEDLYDSIPDKPSVPIQLPDDEIIDNTQSLISDILGFSSTAQTIRVDIELAGGGTMESQMQEFKSGIKDGLSGVSESTILPVGSLARDMQELKSLETQFANASLGIELETVGEKIRLKRKEIEAKKSLMQDEKEFGKSQIMALVSTAASASRAIFGNSKEGAIASALINAGQAIVRQYSDLPLAAAIPASAVVAASTMKQISDIRNTEFGDSGGSVSAPDGGIAKGISDRENVPTQEITFNPRMPNPMSGMVVKNEVLVDRRGLAIQTKMGEEEIRNSQKSVTSGA